MKRTNNRAVATGQTRKQRYCKAALALTVSALTASASWVAGGSNAHAFGGYGERIISSQVVSDVAVGNSHEGGESHGGDTGGGCANGDCGGAGAGSGAGGGGGAGGYQAREYGQPDLFYNFYTQGGANSANAQMYTSPVPVPPHVGQTFLTYQPFHPHEMLYKHTDKFHNYYDGGRGMNRTRVQYSYPPVKTAVSNFYWNVLRIPR